MNNKIENFIQAAYANQKEFQESVELVKSAIRNSINDPSIHLSLHENLSSKVNRTGWLKGFLSYPWMMICTIIPIILESID